jgi:hypothetical protein
MDIEWQGERYSYEPEAIDYATAVAIKKHTGWGLRTWGRECEDVNADAMNALWFAVQRQNGHEPRIQDCEVPPIQFFEAVASARKEATDRELSDRAGKAAATARRRTSTQTSKS